jgi:hypothetical protein
MVGLLETGFHRANAVEVILAFVFLTDHPQTTGQTLKRTPNRNLRACIRAVLKANSIRERERFYLSYTSVYK